MKIDKNKRLKEALKASSKLDLLEVILGTLDCPSHFRKPIIRPATFKTKDEDYSYGKGAIVICGQCVNRMRKALILKAGEPIPTNADYFNKNT